MIGFFFVSVTFFYPNGNDDCQFFLDERCVVYKRSIYMYVALSSALLALGDPEV